jgi:hypothetical protein
MAKHTTPGYVVDWLTANGINIRHIPFDSDLTISTSEDGQRTINYEEFIHDDAGIIDFGDGPRTVRRSAPLTVEPPDWWQPYEKPTREQLQAAVDRVRTMAEAANTKPDAWALHPAAVLAALDGERQPDTVLTFPRQLTEAEYEEIKARWIKEHGGGRQNHAGPVTFMPAAEEAEARAAVCREDAEHNATRAEAAEQRCGMLAAELEQARKDVGSSDLAARRAMEQRQEMAEERYALQERRDQLAATLHDVLGHFVHKGHPGEPCLQSGWIAEKTVAKWRAVLTPPAAEEQTARECICTPDAWPPHCPCRTEEQPDAG